MARGDGPVVRQEERHKRTVGTGNPFAARDKVIRFVWEWMLRIFWLKRALPWLPTVDLRRSYMICI